MADQIPARGTDEYRWWRAGAHAEARARAEARNTDHRKLYDFVDSITSAGHWAHHSEARIAWTTFDVFALADAPLRQRLRWAWRVLRG